MSLVTPRKGYKSVPWLFGKEIEIPVEWKYGRIEHFCNKITSGGTPNRDNSEYYGGQIPWIKSGELKNNFLSESEEKISEKGLSESSAKLFPKNTLLIAMYGVTIGKTAILEKEATTNQAICAILPNTNFDSFYLQQLLISMKNILISFGMGAGQPNINQEIIKTLHIPLPPLPEQQKIATILSNVDNLIESTGKVITHSKKVKTGLMQKLLTRGIGHTKFKKVNFHFGMLVEIPEKWEVRTLKEYVLKIGSGVTPRGGSSVYLKKGIPLIRSQNVHFKGLTLDNVVFISQDIHNDMKNSKLMDHDVLLNITGASIGRCTYVHPNFGEGNVNQHVCIIRAKALLLHTFLSYVLSSNLLQNIIQSSQVGLSREGLNFKEIGDFIFPLPPLPEQQKIATILSNIDSKITSQEQYKEKLEKLKKSLMQNLLTGEVRV